MPVLETILTCVLMFLYLALWRVKRMSQRKATGIDPEVLARSIDPLQRFMHVMTRLITLWFAGSLVAHALLRPVFPSLRGIAALDALPVDMIGFLTGLLGLSFCLTAQIQMGKAWRVGIDENVGTDLVTTGLYRWIRNPTYLGIFILNAGLFLIWPTWPTFVFGLAFWMFLEVQVRCEEAFLLRTQGDSYREYMSRTKRYLPFLY